MIRMFSSLLLLILLVPATSYSEDCPLSSTQRVWVQEGVSRFVLDSLHVSGMTGVHPDGTISKGSIGYALTLPGQVTSSSGKVDPGTLGTTSIINTCQAATTFPPHCISQDPVNESDGFLMSHDFCVQLSCEGRAVYTNHVYATMRPENLPDRRHVFEYSQPGGKLVFDPNPSVTWRIDATNVKRVVVTGEFFQRLDFVARSGEKSRLSRSGHVVMTVNEEEGLDTMALNVVFPALMGAPPIVADLILNDHNAAQADGTITAAGQVLSTITLKPGMPPEFAWSESCN